MVEYYEVRILGLNDTLQTTGTTASIILPVELKSDTLVAEVRVWRNGLASGPSYIEFIPEAMLVDLNKDGEIETHDLLKFQSEYLKRVWRKSYWTID
jgi:hypothetical protein